MHTKEYFSQLKTLESENIHPEFHTYATVWIKSRMPEAYKELKASYKAIESDIYWQHECNGTNNKTPF